MARLTTKGLQPDQIFGGKPAIEKMDIAAACSRLPSLHFHLLMAKYCDDVKSALDAMGELQDVMTAKSDTFAEMDPFKRTGFAAAILEEFVSDRRCRSCKGTGHKSEEARVVACKPCGATGVMSASIRRRSSSCGIPYSTYRDQGIDKHYQVVMDYLLEVEIGALAKVSRKAS